MDHSRENSPLSRTRGPSSSNTRSRSPSPSATEEVIVVTPPPAKKVKDGKDGDWSFPPNIEFPITTKVALRFFKMAQNEKSGNNVKININNSKVEVKLNKEDFMNRSSLQDAIIRESELQESCKSENIKNPKFDFFTTRTDTKENYKITKMGLIVDRLGHLISKRDLFTVEIMEQVVTFASKSPIIKIMVNSEAMGPGKKNRLKESEAKELTDLLKSCNEGPNESTYSSVLDKIRCGRCKEEFKTKQTGNAQNMFYYFKEKHFKPCGKRGTKRGREDESEDDRIKRLESNRNRLLEAFKKTPLKAQKPIVDSDDDFVDDPDFSTEAPTVQEDIER